MVMAMSFNVVNKLSQELKPNKLLFKTLEFWAHLRILQLNVPLSFKFIFVLSFSNENACEKSNESSHSCCVTRHHHRRSLRKHAHTLQRHMQITWINVDVHGVDVVYSKLTEWKFVRLRIFGRNIIWYIIHVSITSKCPMSSSLFRRLSILARVLSSVSVIDFCGNIIPPDTPSMSLVLKSIYLHKEKPNVGWALIEKVSRSCETFDISSEYWLHRIVYADNGIIY